MIDMVKALVTLPEEQRRTMMTDRLSMFADMADAERKQAMAQMMQAVDTLPEGDKKKLFRSRFEVLAGFPEEKRMRLMMTHMGILQEHGEPAMMKEMALTQAVVPDLSPAARQFVQSMMQSMMQGGMQGGMHGGMAMTGMGHSGSMGTAASRPAEPPKRKPWWRFW